MTDSLLAASSRMAMAAFLHDLGKFAERAGVYDQVPELEANQQLYCPHHKQHPNDRGWFSHKHAACTSLAMNELEAVLPDMVRGDCFPFASRSAGSDITDSLANAAAAHHKPDSFLQWLVATADRVASGFEREEFDKYNASEEKTSTGRNHYQARQLTLFESISLTSTKKAGDSQCYPLRPLSPESIFPRTRNGYEPASDEPARKEYRQLWDAFTQALRDIPATHRRNPGLWLDHFDSLWLVFTHAIPSATAFGTRPDVSLYDHSKATAALATALWRYHHERGDEPQAVASAQKTRADWDDTKLLLIQGDFFGIQDFIFAGGSQTNRQAAKLLRGRSFQVSLLSELAALKVLEALQLPSTSQIVNAAGKFLIVAPNTDATRARLTAVRDELNQWFLQRCFGEAGIGLAWLPASCNDFVQQKNQQENGFKQLMTRLFAALDREKLRRFDLCADQAPAVLTADYSQGACDYNGKLPAETALDGGRNTSRLAADQIAIGEQLANPHFNRLLIATSDADLRDSGGVKSLQSDVFGYRIAFAKDEEIVGRFGELAGNGGLRRIWDFSLPDSAAGALWNGYARRYINGYVPLFDAADQIEHQFGKYAPVKDETDFDRAAPIKTLGHIACEDRKLVNDEREAWLGQVALTTLKGDVDNLGAIFQNGLERPTFAKMAALSRQTNMFFAVWLPWHCRQSAPNTYTVFAGGDDFFLIGPWHSTQKLAGEMREAFRRYVAGNDELSFSAGMVMTKPGVPIHYLAAGAEEALEDAKQHRKQKDCVSVFGIVAPWQNWPTLQAAEARLDELREQYRLSTGYVYGLLQLSEMAGSNRPEMSIWRSYLNYRTRRFVVDKLKNLQREQKDQAHLTLVQEIGHKGLVELGQQYRIVLHNHLYQQRG